MTTIHVLRKLDGEAAVRARLLDLNNENARETSLLTPDRFDRMIAAARVATIIDPGVAFLLVFDQSSPSDGGHFVWFRDRFESFLYIDRIVVGRNYRRLGLGRRLYEDLFRRAEFLGHTTIACEVNAQPPNPVSDAFHREMGFSRVGTATSNSDAKMVRYLVRRQ